MKQISLGNDVHKRAIKTGQIIALKEMIRDDTGITGYRVMVKEQLKCINFKMITRNKNTHYLSPNSCHKKNDFETM